MEEIYNIRAFDLDRIMGMDPSFLSGKVHRGREVYVKFRDSQALSASCPPLARLTETEHNHDQTVTSVGITCQGNLDLDKMQAWVSKLLRTKGRNMFLNCASSRDHGTTALTNKDVSLQALTSTAARVSCPSMAARTSTSSKPFTCCLTARSSSLGTRRRSE